MQGPGKHDFALKNKAGKLTMPTFPTAGPPTYARPELWEGLALREEKPQKGVLTLGKVQHCFDNPERDILITELRLLGE